jgi:hypothetical protein
MMSMVIQKRRTELAPFLLDLLDFMEEKIREAVVMRSQVVRRRHAAVRMPHFPAAAGTHPDLAGVARR